MNNLIDLYREMLNIREAELLLAGEYSKNLFKTPVHLANGAEAIPCGILPYLSDRRVFGTYRNHHWYLRTTNDAEGFYLELLGKNNAPTAGRGGSMHLSNPPKGMILTSAVVATTIPIAVGDAWAGKKISAKERTIVFFGDGAVEEGVFWESLNIAALNKIQILFVCEDNELAIHAHKNNRQAFNMKLAVESFGVSYFNADAYRVQNVTNAMPAVLEALKNGPVFLHLKYFRFLEHVGVESDFKFNYRKEPEKNLIEFDPVLNCEQDLLKEGHSSEELKIIKLEIVEKHNAIYQNCKQQADTDSSKIENFLFQGKNE